MDIPSRRRGCSLKVAAGIEVTEAEAAMPFAREMCGNEITDIDFENSRQFLDPATS